MRIGKWQIKVYFFKKNLKVRGTKLWEIIPANSSNSRGCIISSLYTHVFIKAMEE